MNYSQLASILITGVIAYSLYLMIVHENLEVSKLEKKFLLFCFVTPAVLTPLPFITNSYGGSEGWCWILQNGVINQFWMLLEFYLPFLIVVVLNSYFYYKIYMKIWKGNCSTFDVKMMQKLMQRLKYYPLSLILCFGVAFVHRVYYIFSNEQNYYLDLVAGCLVAIYGFINTIVYGLTRSVRKSIKRTFANLLFSSDNSDKNDEKFLKS